MSHGDWRTDSLTPGDRVTQQGLFEIGFKFLFCAGEHEIQSGCRELGVRQNKENYPGNAFVTPFGQSASDFCLISEQALAIVQDFTTRVMIGLDLVSFLQLLFGGQW